MLADRVGHAAQILSCRRLSTRSRSSPARNALDFGLTAAGGIVASVPPLLLTLALQRYLIGGLSSGAMKG